MRKKFAVLKNVSALLAALLIFSSSSEAATIYLKDGRTLKGTIVGATALEVQVNSDTGLINLNSNEISRIDYSDPDTSVTPSATPAMPAVKNPVPPPAPPYVGRPLYTEEEFNPDALNQSFSIHLGAGFPLSDVDFSSTGGGSDDNGDGGVVLGAQYLYQTSPRHGFGLNVEIMNRSENTSNTLLPVAETRVSGNSFLLLPVYKLSLVTKGRTRPYLLGGVGLNRTSELIDAQPLLGGTWPDTNSDETRTMVNESHWGVASTARFGIDFYQRTPTFVSFELGWTGTSNSAYSATGDGRFMGLDSVTGNLNIFSIAGRFGWKF